jgi:hypothetical protein
MATTNIEAMILARVRAFTDDIARLVRSQSIDSLQALLGRSGGGKRGNGAAAAGPSRGRSSGKRTPEQVEKRAQDVLAFIKSNPGLGSEKIALGMKTKTKELTLPITRLRETKRITMKGHRRAAKYFAK